jgi:hypothetical protein
MTSFKQKKVLKLLPASLLFLVLFSAACSEPEKGLPRGPKEVLTGYLDAMISGRLEQAYQSLSSRDRAVRTLNDFVGDRSEEEGFIRNQIAKKINYTIKDVTVIKDRARARVDISAPDFEAVMKDLLSGLSIQDLPGGSLDAHTYVSGLLGRQVKKYRDKGVPMKTTTEFFDLVQEGGEGTITLLGDEGT